MPRKKAAPKVAEKAEAVSEFQVRHAAVQEFLPDRDVYWSDEKAREKARSK